MATAGDSINKANLGTDLVYTWGNYSWYGADYFTYIFANSLWVRHYSGTPSSIFKANPSVNVEFWRYSISQQAWVFLHSYTDGRDTSTAYRVRCPYNPVVDGIGPSLRYSYDGSDSYLFCLKHRLTAGEHNRTHLRVNVYSIGADTTYDETVKGRLVYGRSEDKAFEPQIATPMYNYSLTQSCLTTEGRRGSPITPGDIKRMTSVKSAISFT